MTTWRLLLYVAGLAAVMAGLVAIERFTEPGLRLLVPSSLARTLGTSEYSLVEWLQVIALMVFGVGGLVVFASVIGNEGLWQSLLGDGYRRIAKISAEELAELVGYWLWLVGRTEYTIACRRQRRLAGELRERRRPARRR